jgi:hypothetical protein
MVDSIMHTPSPRKGVWSLPFNYSTSEGTFKWKNFTPKVCNLTQSIFCWYTCTITFPLVLVYFLLHLHVVFTAERPFFSVYCRQEHFLVILSKNLNKLISIYRVLLLSCLRIKGSTPQYNVHGSNKFGKKVASIIVVLLMSQVRWNLIV